MCLVVHVVHVCVCGACMCLAFFTYINVHIMYVCVHVCVHMFQYVHVMHICVCGKWIWFMYVSVIPGYVYKC